MNIFVETAPGQWSGPFTREGLREVVRSGAAGPQSLCREGAAGPLRTVAYYLGDRLVAKDSAPPVDSLKLAETTTRAGSLGLLTLGSVAALLVGLGLLAYATLFAPISADGQVVNLGLMNERLVLLVLGGILGGLGILGLVLRGVLR